MENLSITITKSEYKKDEYEVNYTKYQDNGDFIEITGTLKPYHTGRDYEYEFEPGWFADKMEEDYFDENHEQIEKEILDTFYSMNFTKGGGVSYHRINNSAGLKLSNFNNYTAHINLVRLKTQKTRGYGEYKDDYLYAIEINGFGDGRKVMKFKTREDAEVQYEKLIKQYSMTHKLDDTHITNNADGGMAARGKQLEDFQMSSLWKTSLTGKRTAEKIKTGSHSSIRNFMAKKGDEYQSKGFNLEMWPYNATEAEVLRYTQQRMTATSQEYSNGGGVEHSELYRMEKELEKLKKSYDTSATFLAKYQGLVDKIAKYKMKHKLYANGGGVGEIRRFDRHANMSGETRRKILEYTNYPIIYDDMDKYEMVKEALKKENFDKHSFSNYLYGLFDGYDYSDTDDFKQEMAKIKNADPEFHKKISSIYEEIRSYPEIKYSNGGGVDDKPYQVYNYDTQTIEGYFDNEIQAEEFASQFDNATVYDIRVSNGGGVGTASSKIYKLRAETLNDFLAFLQNGMYMKIKSFTVEPIGVPDVVVTFETDSSLSEIKAKLREVPDSHVMLETVKPINEYTGEREEDEYAKGGGVGYKYALFQDGKIVAKGLSEARAEAMKAEYKQKYPNSTFIIAGTQGRSTKSMFGNGGGVGDYHNVPYWAYKGHNATNKNFLTLEEAKKELERLRKEPYYKNVPETLLIVNVPASDRMQIPQQYQILHLDKDYKYDKQGMLLSYAKGGGVGTASSKIYKLRAETLNDFLAFLQNGMYMKIKSFTVEPIGVPDVVVTFETDSSLSEIKAKLREVPDSHVMLETVKPINEYTGEREEDEYAKGGGVRSKAAIAKDRKYFNKNEKHEVAYANRSGRYTQTYGKSGMMSGMLNTMASDGINLVEKDGEDYITGVKDLKTIVDNFKKNSLSFELDSRLYNVVDVNEKGIDALNERNQPILIKWENVNDRKFPEEKGLMIGYNDWNNYFYFKLSDQERSKHPYNNWMHIKADMEDRMRDYEDRLMEKGGNVGRSKAAIAKDRKYFNKNEKHEVAYANRTGRYTQSYNRGFGIFAKNGMNMNMSSNDFSLEETLTSINSQNREVRYDLSISYNKEYDSVIIKELDYTIPNDPYPRTLQMPLSVASKLYSMLDKMMSFHVYGPEKAKHGKMVASAWNVALFDKDGHFVSQTQIDHKSESLAWKEFEESGHKKEAGMYMKWEKETDPDEIAQAKHYRMGGMAADGAKINKQEKNDYYHISDVEQRLIDGEIEIDGKKLNSKEAKEYIYKHISKIIKLGRKGWNPFDTVYIIEGDFDETDNPEDARKDGIKIKAADGAEIDEMVSDWKAVKKALGTGVGEGNPQDMKILDIDSNTVHKPIMIDYEQDMVIMENPEFGRTGNSIGKVKFFFDAKPSAQVQAPVKKVLSPAEILAQKSGMSGMSKTAPAKTTTTTTPAPLKTKIDLSQPPIEKAESSERGKYYEMLKDTFSEAKGEGVVLISDSYMDSIEEAILEKLSELSYQTMLNEVYEFLTKNNITLKSKIFMNKIKNTLTS